MPDVLMVPLKLDELQFVADPELEQRATKLIASQTRIKNVYTYFRGMFQARLYLGNAQVCIACGGPAKCLRMADCALLYFWPYRQKPNRHIVETDLNLGLAAAQRELRENFAIKAHMEYVEQAMIARRALDPANKRKARERVGRGELFAAWGEFKACLESVKLTAVERQLGAYEFAINEVIGTSQNLVSGIDRQIFNS